MNFKNLTQTLSTLYTTSRYTPRRKVEYRKIGKTELIMEIYFELKLLEFSGDTYWNYSKVLEGIYKRKGFPCKGDTLGTTLFVEAVNYIEAKFVPIPGRRPNYTFELKEDSTGVNGKFLQR